MSKPQDKDYNVEDDQEAVSTFENAANSEFQRLIARLKAEAEAEKQRGHKD